MLSSSAARRLLREAPPARRQRWRLARHVLDGLPDGSRTVLDAGCGDGLFAARLARRHPDWRVVAADLSTEATAAAREEGNRLRAGRLHVVRADLTRAPFAKAYDVVLLLECLTEIPDDAAAVRTAAAALRPDGLLIAHVPTRDWRPLLPGSERRWRHEIRHGYTVTDITALLQGAGLQVIGYRATQRSLVTLAQEVRDRTKHRSARLRLALLPAFLLAEAVDTAGFTWGAPRGLFVLARPAPATTSR